jgi:hypothetical protein
MKKEIIMFCVMVVVGMLFNPMNVLAYRINDLYLSLTLFYGGLLMASNMIWAHEIVHYLYMGSINIYVFLFGIILSCFVVFLLRSQLFVNDTQWLKRMISHHSTALTTSHKILETSHDDGVRTLATNIIDTQEKEISVMKSLIR